MPQDFVIFCRPRSGSYSLVSRLNSCSDITCHGELFKRNHLETADPAHRLRLSFKKAAERNARPLEFIDELRNLDARKHVGFKIFPQHLNWAPGAIEHLKRPQTRKIVLYRTPLETYASALRAKSTGAWVLKEGKTLPPEVLDAKVRFTRKSFQRFSRAYNQFICMCHLISGLENSFVLDYRQINDAHALDALLEFIGSTATAAQSATKFRKQYTGNLEDAFENWGALADFTAKVAAPLQGPQPSHPLG